ncbi:MAG: hypothetical protein KatS3mg108_0707 [Isosphaeraceae bacterium]|nr:MAG: hypothetical protein KatS3mg108_0707 [Isosphaeraceae bacterium]
MPMRGSGMDSMTMSGMYGPYPMSRESSGTAWVPDASPLEGVHGMYGAWSTMLYGYAYLVYDHQGGRRGDEKAFGESMLMGMAQRPLGGGTFGLRSMLSLDPTIGKDGYPLLFQTGETADGRTPLIDRQHPHDFFMELAATYSHPVTDDSAAFVYVGYPGEPAIGPPTFMMRRLSGVSIPEAPLGHHWLDSTHITFGVATVGYVWRDWKLEASAFNGHEPDELRWNFDDPRFSSHAGRISYNPTEHWALQVSYGALKGPEQLEPDIDQRRMTASAIYDLPFEQHHWQTTLAWGRNDKRPGATTDALLLESAISLYKRHTVFMRAERVEKDELFEASSPLAGQVFDAGKLSVGYIYDIPLTTHVSFGLGGLGSAYSKSDRLDAVYGDKPLSYMLFARLKIN